MFFRVHLGDSYDFLKALPDVAQRVPQASRQFSGPQWRNVADASRCCHASSRHKSLIVFQKRVVCAHALASQSQQALSRTSQSQQAPRTCKVLQLSWTGSTLAGVKTSHANFNKKKKKRGKSEYQPRQTTLKTYKGGEALHVLMNDSLVARADWDTIIQGVALAVHTKTDVALAEVERGGRQRIPPKLPQQLPTDMKKSQLQRKKSHLQRKFPLSPPHNSQRGARGG